MKNKGTREEERGKWGEATHVEGWKLKMIDEKHDTSTG